MTATCNDLRITILVDDKNSCGLAGEKGFAVWIEASGRKILFDTGQGQALFPNAAELRCDLSQLDALVLSHGHYDHSGAVSRLLNEVPSLHLFCHTGAFVSRYSVCTREVPRLIAVAAGDRDAIFAHQPELVTWVNGPQQVVPGVIVSGPIPRLHPLEDTGGPFYLDPQGTCVDRLEDDMALGINTGRGLIIVTGCCHAGLINTVEQMRSITGVVSIVGIVGGLHLLNASTPRLDATYAALRQWQPEFIIPCHCTGELATTALREEFGSIVSPGHAGFRIIINGGSTSPAGARQHT